MSIIKKFGNFFRPKEETPKEEVKTLNIDIEKLKKLQIRPSEKILGKTGLEGDVEVRYGDIYITYATQRDGNAYTRGRESKLGIEKDIKLLKKEFPDCFFRVIKAPNGIYSLKYCGEKIDEESIMDYIRDILIDISDDGGEIDFEISTHFPDNATPNNVLYEKDFKVFMKNLDYANSYKKLEPYIDEIKDYLKQYYTIVDFKLEHLTTVNSLINGTDDLVLKFIISI